MSEKTNILNGTAMRERRKELRIPLEELASIVGSTASVISNLERGLARRPNLVIVRRIEDALRVEKGSFFS